MKNQEKTALNRVLKDQHFKDAEKAIKGGEETGSLKNPELVKGLIEGYISAISLNAKELISAIEVLKNLMQVRTVEELKAKADKGEATAEDAMLALMIATSSKMGEKK